METAAIRYRVADFLKKQPPFHAIAEEDLLQLSGQGRVKFFEPGQYILSQGASRHLIHVIQQGAVSLWDERGPNARLLDVRGAGDLLGIDQFHELRVYPYSATSASDVLVYSFPVEEFQSLVEKYPDAEQFVAAYGNLTAGDRPSREYSDPQDTPLRKLVAEKEPPVCDQQTSIRDAARYLEASGYGAIAVLDSEKTIRGILTVDAFLGWIGKGDGNGEQSVAALLDASPIIVSAATSVADGTLMMSAGYSDALAMTSDGSPQGSLQAVVTIRNLGRAFGDRPVDILREIAYAPNPRALRDLNHRARQFTLRYLNDASSTDWLTRFTSTADVAIVKRLIAIVAPEHVHRRWCFCGPGGRGEALPRLSPEIVLIDDTDRYAAVLRLVSEQLEECGYLPPAERPFEPSFYVASKDEWKKRYLDWVGEPILKQIYNAYPFFDLRPILGIDEVWRELEATVLRAVNREFLHVVSNDCLTNLPPLTFFQNMVLDEAGEETNVFRLEETALRPLVYVGRVFGFATRKTFSTSTLERFALAQHAWPANGTIFREASEAMRIVLWQQGRVGIREETGGAELPPALLGAYDRQLLKSCFRSIMRLLEFTGDLEWLKTL